MKKTAYLLALLVVAACSAKKQSDSPADSGTTGTGTAIPSASPDDSNTGPAATATKNTRPATVWTYNQTNDDSGRPAYKASLVSPDQFAFGFPYTGTSTVTLTIRQRNGTDHVYLEVLNGQFNRSFQGGKLPVRFDDQPPVVYAFSAAANGRGNIMFFDAGRPLIDRIKAARTVRVEVGFEGNGKRSVSFPTARLRWTH